MVGIDLGGTKVAVSTLRNGRFTDSKSVETDTSNADALMAELVDLVRREEADDVRAVGIGVPGAVDFATGTSMSGVNVPIRGVAVRDVLGEMLGLPVYVDNDGNVAALAEAWEAGAIAVRNLVMLTLGTGVGGGLVLDGRIYRGSTGAAAELGHTIVGLDLAGGAPRSSSFPQSGSLESLASGSALDLLAVEAADRHPESALGKLKRRGVDVSGRDAVNCANGGDPVSIGILRVLGERLGIGIANAINTFDPDVVAIGGGVSSAGALVLDPAREVARGYVLAGAGSKTVVRVARHGEEAGVRGAALMAQIEYERESRL